MKAKTNTMALLTIFITLTTITAHAQAVVGPNVDVTASNDTAERQQVEPTITVDPRNASIVVAGAQDYRLLSVGGHRWHGYYRSTDGGQTWNVSLVPGFPGDNSPAGSTSPLKAFTCTSDPVMAFDNNGNVYYVGISCRPLLHLFVVKYTNDGATYSSATAFPTSTYSIADKPWIAVDNSGGPDDGNVYISYDDALRGTSFIRSTDGGQTWSLPIVSSPGGLSSITVDTAGRVIVSSDFAGGRSNQTNIVTVTSTDGGQTFKGREIVGTATFAQSPLPGNQFRDVDPVPQLASDNSGIYIVYADYTLGNSNVMFSRSTDGGTTWTSPVIINDVLAGQHFFPSVAASNGVVSIIWYDSRNGQLPNGTITGLDVYYAESTNGGISFAPNLRVTSVGFDPNIVERADIQGGAMPFMGDYIQVAASPGTAHAIWADNRDACDHIVQPFGCTDQDAFTATITT